MQRYLFWHKLTLIGDQREQQINNQHSTYSNHNSAQQQTSKRLHPEQGLFLVDILVPFTGNRGDSSHVLARFQFGEMGVHKGNFHGDIG